MSRSINTPKISSGNVVYKISSWNELLQKLTIDTQGVLLYASLFLLCDMCWRILKKIMCNMQCWYYTQKVHYIMLWAMQHRGNVHLLGEALGQKCKAQLASVACHWKLPLTFKVVCVHVQLEIESFRVLEGKCRVFFIYL